MKAAERLATAIRFQTVSLQEPATPSPTVFRAFHEFLDSGYPHVHRMLETEVVNSSSRLYTWAGSDPALKPVLFSAHLDVVPAETEALWSRPPFSGAIEGDYVWGRGALDDKPAVLGVLEGAEALIASGFRPARTIFFAFGHDEEVGGNAGAAKIASVLRSRGVALEAVLDEGQAIVDGVVPSAAKPVAMIGTAEKGRATFELIARAPGGHAAIPVATSAIGILCAALQRVERTPMPARLTVPMRQLVGALAAHLPPARRLVGANLWLFEPLVLRRFAASPTANAAIRTTTAVTMLQSGTKDNMLPPEARALVNARILPGDSVAMVAEHLRAVVNDPRISIEPRTSEEPSPVSAIDTAVFRTLAATIGRVFPQVAVAPALVLAGSDAKHYVPLADDVYRFRPLRFGRDDLTRVHGIDERVAISDYEAAIRFYVELLRAVGGG
jgi:carboxypeptidase PM20D1